MHGAPENNAILCLNFCRYYKPGKAEDLECRGSVVVRRLREKGRKISLAKPERVRVPARNVVADLTARVCTACPFRESDCDFILTEGTAPPCGGVVLLLHLLAGGEITPEELDRKACGGE